MIAYNVVSMQSATLWQTLWSKSNESPAMVASSAKFAGRTVRNRWGHREMAKTAMRQGDYAGAKMHLMRVKANAQLSGDFKGTAIALNELAYMQILMGNLRKAEQSYIRVCEFWRAQRQDQKLIAINEYTFFVWDYSVFLRGQGELVRARQLEQKLELLTRGLSTRELSLSRADRFVDRGQFLLAEQLYEDAFIDAGTQGDLKLQLAIADKLAPLYEMSGKAQLAQTLRARKLSLLPSACQGRLADGDDKIPQQNRSN